MARPEYRNSEMRQLQRRALEQKIASLLELEGHQPLQTPENAEELNKELTQQYLVAAQAKGDEFMVRYFTELLADPDRLSHAPSSKTAFLDPTQAVVEAAIIKDSRYAQSIPVIAIEEWPTGTLNAESIRFKEGFAVLLNAGSNVLFHQVIAALLREPEAELEAAGMEFLAALLIEYAGGLNLLSIPVPVTAGMEIIKLSIYSQALRNFIVAHEYGHILKGHFQAAPTVNPSSSAEVNEQFIRKSWEQEFQADDAAVELTLGKDFPTGEQRRVLADVSSTLDVTVIRAAAELQAASAAPVIMFTIMSFFDLATRVIKDRSKKTLYETHPPPEKRRDRYVQWMLDRHLESQHVYGAGGGWSMASDLLQIEPILYDKLAECLKQMLDKGLITREELDLKRARMIAEG